MEELLFVSATDVNYVDRTWGTLLSFLQIRTRIVLIKHVQIYTGKQHLPTILTIKTHMKSCLTYLRMLFWLVFLRAALLYTAGVLQDMVAWYSKTNIWMHRQSTSTTSKQKQLSRQRMNYATCFKKLQMQDYFFVWEVKNIKEGGWKDARLGGRYEITLVQTEID